MSIIADDLSLHLPNIRACFLPDPGYALVEADLARADAQVAAWDAGAADLKRLLQDDADLHSDNAQLLYGTHFDGRRFVKTADVHVRSLHVNGMSFRDNAKRWVHGTNFAGGSRTLSSTTVLPEDHVEACQRWWLHERHPELGAWHRRIAFELASRKSPVIHNAFGFRRVYTGGDRQSNLLGQVLAWICQSTVAIVINKGMLNIDCGREMISQERCGHCIVCRYPFVELLLQIHDSLLKQMPLNKLNNSILDKIRSALNIPVPYDDVLHIPVEIKWSDKNWGEMQKWVI